MLKNSYTEKFEFKKYTKSWETGKNGNTSPYKVWAKKSRLIFCLLPQKSMLLRLKLKLGDNDQSRALK